MDRNLIYIPYQGSYISNQGSGLKKLGILFSPNSTRLSHQVGFFLSKSSPICDQAGLNPIFHVQFLGRASFFGFCVRKFDLYPTYCLLPIENSCPNWVNILVEMAFFRHVRFIMLDGP